MTNTRSNTETPDAAELADGVRNGAGDPSPMHRVLAGSDAPGAASGRPARRRRLRGVALFALVMAAGLVLAFAGSDYVLQLAGDALCLGMACMGLDFLVGYTGLVSFGQAAWAGS
jgi:hypothetical protein